MWGWHSGVWGHQGVLTAEGSFPKVPSAMSLMSRDTKEVRIWFLSLVVTFAFEGM